MSSAFEINLTPNRNKTAKSSAREPTDVILAPFSAKATVTFEDVPITKTARRFLNLINTTDKVSKVTLTHSLNPEYNLHFEWNSAEIPPNGRVSFEMIWIPNKEVQCRETIHFIDNRNFRKDVIIILKSIKGPKPFQVKRFPTMSSSTSSAKSSLKRKPPITVSNRKPTTLNSTNSKSAMIQKQMKELDQLTDVRKSQNSRFSLKEIKSEKQSLKLTNFNQNARYSMFEETHLNRNLNSNNNKNRYFAGNKENVSPPVTPENASILFDKIKFTPVTETIKKSCTNQRTATESSNLDFLASLPTPSNIRTMNEKGNISELKPKSIEFTPEKIPIQSGTFVVYKKQNESETTSEDLKETSEKSFVEEKVVYTSESFSYNMTDAANMDLRKAVDLLPNATHNNTFIVNKKVLSENSSFSQTNEANISNNIFDSTCATDLSKTFQNKVDSGSFVANKHQTRLSSIAELEENSRSNVDVLKKTLKTSPSLLKRDVKLVGTPLKKCSESLRDLSGKSRKNSMGAMGSMPDLNNMESLQSIEQNRYYYNETMSVNNYRTSSNIYRNRDDFLNISDQSNSSISDIKFSRSEILATSSNVNLNDGKNYKYDQIGSAIQIKIEPETPPKIYEQMNFKNLGNTQIKYGVNSKRLHNERDSPTSSNLKLPSPSLHSSTGFSVSPPKRCRFENAFSLVSSQNVNPKSKKSTFRVSNWKPSQQQGKVRLQKSLSLVRKPISPSKIKEEPRRILYNSENFLQHFINPDPFAATTTLDPFLTSTVYLGEGAIQKYEVEFKNWLNALVSMPSELYTNCEDKIDVGKLFCEVRNKELILAPTKEERSMNYLRKSLCEMEKLRLAAIKLYMSEEITTVCSKIVVYVKKDAIKIRVDRDLHLDVVLQKTVLELLLCFNPLWLRLGLEVVFGEVIHLHSNSDIIGLSTFILNRLFRDKLIERKYSRAYTLSDEYRHHMKQFTIQKILFLLLFLDKAKLHKIIKHNPCLFIKTSIYKETKDVLLKISSLLLASVGDITRELRRFGYVLSHKQTYIDEFDYAFKNLAIDLRDGVRLTRIMEIMLLKDNLTEQLRVPAISRLQRIYNVNLALNALSEADFQLKGDIAASDIVDGHREKTFSLLWQIIYKFRSPKFIAAATTLQQWWRKNWLKVFIRRRIKIKEKLREINAATIIQAYFRGFITRKYFEIYKIERINATICLQKYCRKYLARKYYKFVIKAILQIQRWYKNQKEVIVLRLYYLKMKKSAVTIQIWYRNIKLAQKLQQAANIIRQIKIEAKLQYSKAVVIQRSIKSYTIHKKIHFIVYQIIKNIKKNNLENISAVKIQSFWRMVKYRRDFLIKQKSIIKIQLVWRAFKLCRIEQAKYIKKRKSAITIQSYFRAYLLTKYYRQNYLKLKKAILTIQTHYRALIVRREYMILKEKTIFIQRKFRAILLARKIRLEYIALQYNCILIQQRFRANKLASTERDRFLKFKKAVISIQSRYRALKVMRNQRMNYLKICQAVKFIQIRFRAIILMRKERQNYLATKKAAVIIQTRYRAQKAMYLEKQKYRKILKSVKIIQNRFRALKIMIKQRADYLRLRNSVLTVQRQFRAIKAMHVAKAKYLLIRHNIILIQQRFRAYILMKNERRNYYLLRNNVINIQKYFRANLQMRIHRQQYVEFRKATILVQRKWRATKSMKELRNYYLSLKKSTIYIQEQYRAVKIMKNQRTEYLKLRTVVVYIQKKYRANLLMQKVRSNYLQKRNAVLLLQTKWRAYIQMKKDRQYYLLIRKSALMIQHRYRANKLMQIEQTYYENLYLSILYVQQRFRANYQMRRQRLNYQTIRKCVIKIQIWIRNIFLMRRQRSEYLTIRRACITIQAHFRAKNAMLLQRNKFLKLKTATMIIQRWIRSTALMRQQHERYINMIRAVNVIQKSFKSKRLMETERKNFLKIKASVIKIENAYIAYSLMKTQRNEYLKLKKATIFIQHKYRAKIQMRIDFILFIEFKQAAIKLQAWWRGVLARRLFNAVMSPEMKLCRKQRNAAKVIQKYWRGYVVRKRWQNVHLMTIRQNIKQLNATAQACNTIRYKINSAVKYLRGKRCNINEELNVLLKLEKLSRTLPHCLMDHSSFVSKFCYSIMAQTIRSEIDKQIIEICSRIILNLAKYNSRTADTFQESGLVTIAQMLLRWCDKECTIFNTLCTLIWIFSQCPMKKKIIRKFMTTPEAIFMLRETKKLVLRKEKMRQNVRRSTVSIPATPTRSTKQGDSNPKTLPSLEPDFGIIQRRPYIFVSSVFAFDTVLNSLDIKDI